MGKVTLKGSLVAKKKGPRKVNQWPINWSKCRSFGGDDTKMHHGKETRRHKECDQGGQLSRIWERDSRSGVRPHGLTPHMLFLTIRPRLHDSSFYIKCNTFVAVQPVFVNTTMLYPESANVWKQVPGWSLLIMQPPDQLCKLAGRPVWECGDVMAHFTHLHCGFSQISMHEDDERQWWITEPCLCLWL